MIDQDQGLDALREQLEIINYQLTSCIDAKEKEKLEKNAAEVQQELSDFERYVETPRVGSNEVKTAKRSFESYCLNTNVAKEDSNKNTGNVGICKRDTTTTKRQKLGVAFIGEENKLVNIITGHIVGGVLWGVFNAGQNGKMVSYSLWGFMKNENGDLCDVINIMGGALVDYQDYYILKDYVSAIRDKKCSKGYLANALSFGEKNGFSPLKSYP